jgi:CheY-like chemotaxis protein
MERLATVLLVEDEHLLRGLMAQFLRRVGYEVVEAADGLEGLERYRSEGPFDLVLTDLNLPGLPGVELCRAIRGQKPGQPILVCSGALLDEHRRELSGLGVIHHLCKPFHPESLATHAARCQAGAPAHLAGVA